MCAARRAGQRRKESCKTPRYPLAPRCAQAMHYPRIESCNTDVHNFFLGTLQRKQLRLKECLLVVPEKKLFEPFSQEPRAIHLLRSRENQLSFAREIGLLFVRHSSAEDLCMARRASRASTSWSATTIFQCVPMKTASSSITHGAVCAVEFLKIMDVGITAFDYPGC